MKVDESRWLPPRDTGCTSGLRGRDTSMPYLFRPRALHTVRIQDLLPPRLALNFGPVVFKNLHNLAPVVCAVLLHGLLQHRVLRIRNTCGHVMQRTRGKDIAQCQCNFEMSLGVLSSHHRLSHLLLVPLDLVGLWLRRVIIRVIIIVRTARGRMEQRRVRHKRASDGRRVVWNAKVHSERARYALYRRVHWQFTLFETGGTRNGAGAGEMTRRWCKQRPTRPRPKQAEASWSNQKFEFCAIPPIFSRFCQVLQLTKFEIPWGLNNLANGF